MLLNKLQKHLESIYALDSEHHVHDFLIRDPHLAKFADHSLNARELPEKLLIQQEGEDVNIGLYLDPQLMQRLEENDPTVNLHYDNLVDFWTVLEGVSHFVYFTWNVGFERPISLLELELQAEVDKYILAVFLLRKQSNRRIPRELHYRLFQSVTFDNRLSSEELLRYRNANFFASKFCAYLETQFHKHPTRSGLVNELRRFYRLTRQHKIDAIQKLN